MQNSVTLTQVTSIITTVSITGPAYTQKLTFPLRKIQHYLCSMFRNDQTSRSLLALCQAAFPIYLTGKIKGDRNGGWETARIPTGEKEG